MLSSKSKTKPKLDQSYTFQAIGTTWRIDLYDELSAAGLQILQRAVTATIDSFDRNYSRFRADSLVGTIAAAAGDYAMPADFPELYSFYQQLYDATDGLVTPLIGQMMSDAGYDANYSLRPRATLVSSPAWESVMQFDGTLLRTSQPLLLDFGAAGKGYLADQLAHVLQLHGVTRYCIDASGDILYHNTLQPLRVGLEDPRDATMAIGIAELAEGSLCGSATNRRRWANYNHVMNPQRAAAVEAVSATWVVADTALQADGLATALFFVEPARLQRITDFEYVRLNADGQAETSLDFPGEIFEAV